MDGTVWMALDDDGNGVAVKVMPRYRAHKDQYYDQSGRLTTERNILFQLRNNKHIVNVKDFIMNKEETSMSLVLEQALMSLADYMRGYFASIFCVELKPFIRSVLFIKTLSIKTFCFLLIH